MTEVCSQPVVIFESQNPQLAPFAPKLAVPRDVVSKFDVVAVDESVESLIAKKIQEDTFEKEEAFYFVDLGIIVQKYYEWISALPRVKPYYAIKCNNNPAIVRTLAGLGANFDCASKANPANSW